MSLDDFINAFRQSAPPLRRTLPQSTGTIKRRETSFMGQLAFPLEGSVDSHSDESADDKNRPRFKCCMYPAAGLTNGDYTAADLPDTLSVTYRDPGDGSIQGPITVTKSGSGYSGGGITMVHQSAQGQWETFVGIFEGLSDCLIYDDLTNAPLDAPYPIKVEDTFTVTSVTDTLTSITTPITRMGQCSWAGGSWTLFYNQTTYKWNLRRNANSNVKTAGYQNTPTGTYGTATVA